MPMNADGPDLPEEPADPPRDNVPFVRIARFNSALEAQMARGALLAAGFTCEHENQFSQVLVGPVDFFGGGGGHILCVPQDEADDAREMLRDTPAANNLLN